MTTEAERCSRCGQVAAGSAYRWTADGTRLRFCHGDLDGDLIAICYTPDSWERSGGSGRDVR